MALPVTNLTFHADASVVTDLWTVDTAGSFSVHSTDAGAVNYWDDVEHTNIMAEHQSSATTWQSSSPLMALPCIDFNGSASFFMLRNDADSASKTLSDVISSTAHTILVAFYVKGVTANNAASYDNEAIIADTGGYAGIFLKNTGSGYLAQCYNWDGNEDKVEVSVLLNTSYVLMARHESGNLYASLNGGSETSVASGTTTNLTGAVTIGRNEASAGFFNGRIGEIAIYNAALTGSNLTDAVGYFTAKWLPAASAPSARRLGLLGVG